MKKPQVLIKFYAKFWARPCRATAISIAALSPKIEAQLNCLLGMGNRI